MSAPTQPIRVTLPSGITMVIDVLGMSVAAAEQPQAVALELVDGSPDWRRLGPILQAALRDVVNADNGFIMRQIAENALAQIP